MSGTSVLYYGQLNSHTSKTLLILETPVQTLQAGVCVTRHNTERRIEAASAWRCTDVAKHVCDRVFSQAAFRFSTHIDTHRGTLCTHSSIYVYKYAHELIAGWQRSVKGLARKLFCNIACKIDRTFVDKSGLRFSMVHFGKIILYFVDYN